jgi:hypothetical protein
MTDDLPEWLRALANRAPLITYERERLEEAAALIVSLREALEPFADIAEWDIGDSEADSDIYRPMSKYNVARSLTVGDLRTARALVKPAEAEGKSSSE